MLVLLNWYDVEFAVFKIEKYDLSVIALMRRRISNNDNNLIDWKVLNQNYICVL